MILFDDEKTKITLTKTGHADRYDLYIKTTDDFGNEYWEKSNNTIYSDDSYGKLLFKLLTEKRRIK